MNKVFIMRGIPGSGKSTVAKSFNADAVYSADDYFMNDNGVYCFDKTKIGDAHKQCFASYLRSIMPTINAVVIDNTHIQAWEISPYIAIANYFGFEHEIIQIDCDKDIAFGRQSHGVAQKDHDRMADQLQRTFLPAQWKRAIIKVT